MMLNEFSALDPDAQLDALFDRDFAIELDADAPNTAKTELSLMRLSYSICPLHICDYAICFDDDDAECAAIRNCFPNHDT